MMDETSVGSRTGRILNAETHKPRKAARVLGVTREDALDLKLGAGEVEQESVLAADRLQVRAHDDEVDILESSHGLELDHYAIFDQEVQHVRADLHVPVADRNGDLADEGDLASRQLDPKRLLVNALQKARTEAAMHLDGLFALRPHATTG